MRLCRWTLLFWMTGCLHCSHSQRHQLGFWQLGKARAFMIWGILTSISSAVEA